MNIFNDVLLSGEWMGIKFSTHCQVKNIIVRQIEDFPFGGGALTSDVGALWWKCMQKQENWVLLEGGTLPAAPPGSANVIRGRSRISNWELGGGRQPHQSPMQVLFGVMYAKKRKNWVILGGRGAAGGIP